MESAEIDEFIETRKEQTVASVGDGSLQIRTPVTSWKKMNGHNIVFQRYDYSCGAGALATMLRFYFEDDVNEALVLETIFKRIAKQKEPKEVLADRIQNGLSMLDLIYAARDLGYVAQAAKLPLSKLQKSKAPFIVRIEKNQFKHFVVVRGIREDRVYLADPIRGNIRLSVADFMDQWNGPTQRASGQEPAALFLGKRGFGNPADHPMRVKNESPVLHELQAARQMLFPMP
jgi:predicted double-glycine peptidase